MLVSHDDRAYEKWLGSKGSLRKEDQQYGEWLRPDTEFLVRRTSIYVPGSSQNYSGPKPRNDASYHSRKDGEINEGKKNNTKPSMKNQVATVLENTGLISNLTHKESAQGNSMITGFEETLQKIDEELGLNSVSEDSVSI